ncbi:PadR family transcriptional regulator [Microcella pacifica]|uniref:PadR family transcriptional regulator n=1 Tax=Microcella pacifica TaxID=2591847 RepID=A0A9E5MK43_9MICO|nr:PadR family transcriptional regulator [Microcella pacifica]NHF62161.1 PadR family transcriptional regulator [Microcella pacifica]
MTESSPARDDELPPTAWAVLGVLSFGSELSGYDVKRWADQSLAFFYWAPSQSQIYGELRRLESRGLVVSRVEQTHEAKSRRLYGITDDGVAAMRRWADDISPEAVVLKHPIVLRVWAAHMGDRNRLAEILRQHRETALTRADQARLHAEHSADVPEWHFSSVALEWADRYYRDEAARTEWLIERLSRQNDYTP